MNCLVLRLINVDILLIITFTLKINHLDKVDEKDVQEELTTCDKLRLVNLL